MFIVSISTNVSVQAPTNSKEDDSKQLGMCIFHWNLIIPLLPPCKTTLSPCDNTHEAHALHWLTKLFNTQYRINHKQINQIIDLIGRKPCTLTGGTTFLCVQCYIGWGSSSPTDVPESCICPIWVVRWGMTELGSIVGVPVCMPIVIPWNDMWHSVVIATVTWLDTTLTVLCHHLSVKSTAYDLLMTFMLHHRHHSERTHVIRLGGGHRDIGATSQCVTLENDLQHQVEEGLTLTSRLGLDGGTNNQRRRNIKEKRVSTCRRRKYVLYLLYHILAGILFTFIGHTCVSVAYLCQDM